jgi:DNA-binding response OmpR family regulator
VKLLIIEDDKNILSFLTRGFLEDNYVVDSATDGEDGEYLAFTNSYDVIILDWMLPKKSGIEIIQSLRAKEITTPILILSAKGEIRDKVSGLDVGADDYLSKPFSFEELQARVIALHRRDVSKGINTLKIGEVVVDFNTKTILHQKQRVELTAKEYELLTFLIKFKNSFVSNKMIEEQLWNNQEYINSNVIQVTIYHLRQKISKNFIKSSRNLGYKIENK